MKSNSIPNKFDHSHAPYIMRTRPKDREGEIFYKSPSFRCTMEQWFSLNWKWKFTLVCERWGGQRSLKFLLTKRNFSFPLVSNFLHHRFCQSILYLEGDIFTCLVVWLVDLRLHHGGQISQPWFFPPSLGNTLWEMGPSFYLFFILHNDW